MQKLYTTQSLVDIQHNLFMHGILNSRGNTQVHLFSIQAPGLIGIDSIDIPRLNLIYDEIPDEIKADLLKVFKSGKYSRNFELNAIGLVPGLYDCFLNGLRHTHILSVLSNPLNHFHAFKHNAESHAMSLLEWVDTGTTSTFIEVVLQPRIKMGNHSTLGYWIHQQKTLPELCLEGLTGHQSGQEAASRVFNSTFLARDMKTMPASSDEIFAEIAILILSLWLSLGIIFRVQDIRFERNPWRFSPDDNSPLGIKLETFWDSPIEDLQLQNFVRFNIHKHNSTFEAISDEGHERVRKWIEILSENRRAIFSLNMICEGFRDIARSVGEKSFLRYKIARDGIFKTISGLEGLSTDCKPLDRNGYKTKAADTFIYCWKTIWLNALAVDPTNQILCKATDIEKALRNIYALRSDLAHSDPILMPITLAAVKTTCGELINPGQNDPTSVGISIMMVIDELLEYFLTNSFVLIEMLNGKRPSNNPGG